MTKGSENSRSFLRLLFWEGMAAAGFLHILRHPIANPIWALNFYYGALFFLVAYPLLYVYRWKVAEGCLGMVMWPVSSLLSWGLGVSAYFWLTYWLYFTPYSYSLTQHEIILGLLFVFVYFPLIQPVLGISKHYFSLGELPWILFYSGLGGFLGFLLGKFVDDRFGISMGADSRRFLLWLFLILLGTAVGALAAKRRLQ
ncbi:MAG TPA: hypothetical protein VIJ93_14015 [bacterium]